MLQSGKKTILGLIFDLDGTLANTEMLHYGAWRRTLLDNGIDEFPLETFLQYVGTSNEKVAGDYIRIGGIGKNAKELIAQKQSAYLETIPAIELCPGVFEILQRYETTLQLAVATSSHRREAEEILRQKHIDHYFCQLIGGDMVSRRKPEPEIYLKSCQQLNLAPENCVAFEDSSHGVESARRAGLYVVAVPNQFTREHDFSSAHRVVNSLAEVNDELLGSIVSSVAAG